MKRLAAHTLLLLILLALVGCQKSAPQSEEAPEDSSAENTEEAETDDGSVDTTPLKADFDAELLYSFQGVLSDESDQRPEDNTPVQHHEADLEEGDFVYVEMQAEDEFRTYLMIATPNRTGGYQNGECYPGQGLSSCIRFQAKQSGTYLLMANAASAKSRGAYTLNVYKETEEQAETNAKAHAVVAKESQSRLNRHLRQRQEKRKKRMEERAQKRKEMNKDRKRVKEQREADDAPNTDKSTDAPAEEDAAE